MEWRERARQRSLPLFAHSAMHARIPLQRCRMLCPALPAHAPHRSAPRSSLCSVRMQKVEAFKSARAGGAKRQVEDVDAAATAAAAAIAGGCGGEGGT